MRWIPSQWNPPHRSKNRKKKKKIGSLLKLEVGHPSKPLTNNEQTRTIPVDSLEVMVMVRWGRKRHAIKSSTSLQDRRSYGMIEEHFFQTSLLVLEIGIESVEEEGYVLQMALFLQVGNVILVDQALLAVTGLKHPHAPVVLQTQKGSETLFPFFAVGYYFLLHLFTFLTHCQLTDGYFSFLFLSLFSSFLFINKGEFLNMHALKKSKK